jgi:hypothetical protein
MYSILISEQVNYPPPPPHGKNIWPVPIFVTTGDSLPEFLGLYQTGLILTKIPTPKFGPLNLRSAKWMSVKSRRYCNEISNFGRDLPPMLKSWKIPECQKTYVILANTSLKMTKKTAFPVENIKKWRWLLEALWT